MQEWSLDVFFKKNKFHYKFLVTIPILKISVSSFNMAQISDVWCIAFCRSPLQNLSTLWLLSVRILVQCLESFIYRKTFQKTFCLKPNALELRYLVCNLVYIYIVNLCQACLNNGPGTILMLCICSQLSDPLGYQIHLDRKFNYSDSLETIVFVIFIFELLYLIFL